MAEQTWRRRFRMEVDVFDKKIRGDYEVAVVSLADDGRVVADSGNDAGGSLARSNLLPKLPNEIELVH